MHGGSSIDIIGPMYEVRPILMLFFWSLFKFPLIK